MDRNTGFDRLFRPTSDEVERRFARIDAALRRGEEVPPIDVYRIGDVHFVIDGHHRVAVGRALGWTTINAHVIEVLTAVGAGRNLRLEDLPTKGHERVFAERVPLPPRMRARVELHRGEDFGTLAEMVEAWSFRYMQQRGRMLDRREAAESWFTEEFEPAVEVLRRTGLLTDGTDAEGYLRLSCERYQLLRSHSWDDETIDRLLGAAHRLARARAPVSGSNSSTRSGSRHDGHGPAAGRVDPGQQARPRSPGPPRPPGPAPGAAAVPCRRGSTPSSPASSVIRTPAPSGAQVRRPDADQHVAQKSRTRRSCTSAIRSTRSSCRSRARAASQLADGGVMRVGYADQNGQPFRSVARVLIDRGELTLGEASMQGIRAWGRGIPTQLPELLDENPSYVFFREVPPPPPGSLEARSTDRSAASACRCSRGRTIAVDPRAIPLGAPVFLATTEPLSDTPLQRLVMAQDTGGAIRGPIRADFFWGFGDEAGQQAGRMRQQGRMWLLWPNARRARSPERADRPRRSDEAAPITAVSRPRAPPRPAGRRDTTSAPARRPPHAGSPSRTPRARTARTCRDAT